MNKQIIEPVLLYEVYAICYTLTYISLTLFDNVGLYFAQFVIGAK